MLLDVVALGEGDEEWEKCLSRIVLKTVCIKSHFQKAMIKQISANISGTA